MTTQQSGREAFSPEAIAAFRREKGNGMTSAVGEYTPPEFWDALDEIERLQAALARGSASEVPAERQAVDVGGLRSALKQAAADLKAYGHLAAAGRALAALPDETEVDRG